MKKRQINNLRINELGSVLFRNQFWIVGTASLRRMKLRGVAMRPKQKGPPGLILASTHLPNRGLMKTETFIHESLHVAFPKATEREVRDAARLVTKVLKIATTKTRNNRDATGAAGARIL